MCIEIIFWASDQIKDTKKIAHSKAINSGKKDVQEPLRKYEICLHLLKNKNKNMEDLSLSVS